MVKAIGRNRTVEPGRIEMAVRGDAALIDAMNEITSGMVDTIAPHGMRGYLRVMAQGIKNEIPSDMKDARKAIGSRFRKKGGRDRDTVEAKVGGQVGFTRARKRKLATEAVARRDEDRPGVGISVYNIHWLLFGTSERKHKSEHPTGAMPKHPYVKDGALKSKGQALAKFRELAGKAIEREAKKLRAKGRAQLKAKAAGGAKKAIKGIVRGLT